jgi:hypothetical protein
MAVQSAAAALCLATALVTAAAAHGFMTEPRSRGSLLTQRPVGNKVDGEGEVGSQGWAYCPHCQNGGGTGRLKDVAGNTAGGFWIPYKPLEGKFRNGVSPCGDEDGNNDHSASGRYRAPPSMPFSAEYAAGGTAHFEYDITTPHGGYFEFYLCDVSSTGDLDRSAFSSGSCHLLERAHSTACEGGGDDECGPIDPNHPTRWYLPCRVSDSRDQDQIVGRTGKMAYKIPDIPMSKAVVQGYWLTGNNCNAEGLREYFTSGAWRAVESSNCAGDGGTVGGYRQDHTGTCTTQSGKFPEEFWNCILPNAPPPSPCL